MAADVGPVWADHDGILWEWFQTSTELVAYAPEDEDCAEWVPTGTAPTMANLGAAVAAFHARYCEACK